MWQVLHKPWLSHRRFFCLPRGVVEAGHGRGNPLNRRRHRSLGAGGGVFSTQKVEKAGRRRSFARRQVRMRVVMSASGAKKPSGHLSWKGLAIGSITPCYVNLRAVVRVSSGMAARTSVSTLAKAPARGRVLRASQLCQCAACFARLWGHLAVSNNRGSRAKVAATPAMSASGTSQGDLVGRAKKSKRLYYLRVQLFAERFKRMVVSNPLNDCRQ